MGPHPTPSQASHGVPLQEACLSLVELRAPHCPQTPPHTPYPCVPVRLKPSRVRVTSSTPGLRPQPQRPGLVSIETQSGSHTEPAHPARGQRPAVPQKRHGAACFARVALAWGGRWRTQRARQKDGLTGTRVRRRAGTGRRGAGRGACGFKEPLPRGL